MSNYSKLIKRALATHLEKRYLNSLKPETRAELEAVSTTSDGKRIPDNVLDAQAFNDYKTAYGNELKNYAKLTTGSILARLGLNYSHKALGSALNGLGSTFGSDTLKRWGDWWGESDSRKRGVGQWLAQTLVGLPAAVYLGRKGYNDWGDKIGDSYVKGLWGDFDRNARAGYSKAFSEIGYIPEKALRSKYLIDHVKNKYGPGTTLTHILSGLSAGGLADRAMDLAGWTGNGMFSLSSLGRDALSSLAVMGGTSLGPYMLNKARSTAIDPLPAQFTKGQYNKPVTKWDVFKNNWIHAMIPGGYMTSPYFYTPEIAAKRNVNRKNRANYLDKIVKNHTAAMNKANKINNAVDVGADMLQTAYNRASSAGKSVLGSISRVNRGVDRIVPPEVRYRP